MPLTDQAPYAPTDQVVTVLETYRETGLGGSPITPELLTRMSMGDEIARRVAQTFRLLDLTNELGDPKQNLVAFKQAASDEYQQVLANQLYDVYAPIFAVVGKDPTNKSPTQLEDAFRRFKPDSLRKRMVSLFLGLCDYAGIIEGAPTRKPAPMSDGGSAPKRRAASPPKRTRPSDPPSPPPRLATQKDDARQRYVNLLLDKVAEQETPDQELLDRIERALGITEAAS